MGQPNLVIVPEKCDFCNRNPVVGFAEVQTLNHGLKIKGACGPCGRDRRLTLVTPEQLEVQRYERDVIDPLRPFIARLREEPVDSSIASGISETAPEFACQVPDCVCNGAPIWRDQLEDCGLEFMAVTVKRKDALRVLRAFVACNDFFGIMRRVLGPEIEFHTLPLAECDLVIQKEPPLTIGVGSDKNVEIALAPSPRISNEPHESPTNVLLAATQPNATVQPPHAPTPRPSANKQPSRIVSCSVKPDVTGRGTDLLDRFPRTWANEQKTSGEVAEALGTNADQFKVLLEAHRPGEGLIWDKLDDAQRAMFAEEFRRCLLHGYAFKRVNGTYLSLVARRRQLQRCGASAVGVRPSISPPTGVRKPKPPGPEKPMCSKCGKTRVKNRKHTVCYECYSISHPRTASAGGKKDRHGGDKKDKKKRGQDKTARKAAIAAVNR